MKLNELVKGLAINILCGDLDREIEDIAYDSRKAKKNTLFVCIEGTQVDGHHFIQNAYENGTRCFLVQKSIEIPEGCTAVMVEDTRYALAYTANLFYNQPSSKFILTGVTGTKGKTTTTYMIKAIMEVASKRVGLIGTIGNMICDEKLYATRTTPESLDLQTLFDEMVQKNVDTVVMEVSSHALDLKRVACCEYDIGVFNNLTQDHLDYHKNFDNYLEAKAKLFTMCKTGLVNIDSDYGQRVIDKATCKIYTYGIDKKADISAQNIEKFRDHVELDLVTPWGEGRVQVNIPGTFSIYNALAASGVCLLQGASFHHIIEGLKGISVPGRAEVVQTGKDFTVLVDYAHTPDSLENILSTVKGFAQARIISVFGCGGDRDNAKRPMMGEISARLADFTIITSDNPRTEDPASIIQQIEAGINDKNAYVSIVDRKDAIAHAIHMAKKDDVIVIAGKGDENYQQFATKTIHFDDREVTREILGIDIV